MPYILVDNSKYWKKRGWDWGGLERIWFDPANPKEPEFTVQRDSGNKKWVRFNVHSRLDGTELRIRYRKNDNQHLKEPGYIYGVHILNIKNILTIKNAETRGSSDWHADGEEPCRGPGWRWKSEAIDGRTRKPRPSTTWAIQRGQQGEFRQLLLAMDECCAVTGEKCQSVLEAAHIVPAHEGGREVTDNGILLRADIHRLFDSKPPWFEICPEDGQVVPRNGFRYGPPNLEGAQIPREVHKRIAQALEKRRSLFVAK